MGIVYETDEILLHNLRNEYRDAGDDLRLGLRSQLPHGWAKYVLVDTATGRVLAKHPRRTELQATVDVWKRLGIDARVYLAVGHGANWREGETWQDLRRRQREYSAKRRQAG